jgi:hypothetical protein
MPKLTVTNLTAVPVGTPAYQLSDVSIQDPFPAEGRMVLTVPAGATKSAIVEMGQLQRVKPQLIDFQQKGIISWSSEATDEDPRAEDADLMGGPSIDFLDTATTPLVGGAATVGAFAYGTNLLMGFIQAVRRFVDPATPATKYVDIEAIDPGIAGDSIGVVLINDAGVIDPSNIEYAETLPTPAGYSRVLEIHILPATFTWVTLAAILNDVVNGIVPRTAAFLAGSFRLQSGANLGATAPTDQALALLSGGVGVPLMLNVGDTAGVITQLTDLLVRYDIDLTASPMLLGDSAIVRLRSSGGGVSAFAGTGIG